MSILIRAKQHGISLGFFVDLEVNSWITHDVLQSFPRLSFDSLAEVVILRWTKKALDRPNQQRLPGAQVTHLPIADAISIKVKEILEVLLAIRASDRR